MQKQSEVKEDKFEYRLAKTSLVNFQNRLSRFLHFLACNVGRKMSKSNQMTLKIVTFYKGVHNIIKNISTKNRPA
jgi:hypothetical protein